MKGISFVRITRAEFFGAEPWGLSRFMIQGSEEVEFHNLQD